VRWRKRRVSGVKRWTWAVGSPVSGWGRLISRPLGLVGEALTVAMQVTAETGRL
jgi:hypothetical protein